MNRIEKATLIRLFRKFNREYADWADETFKQSTMQSRIAHIRRELEEIEADPYDGSEIADVILLLMHQARSYNIDLMADLLAKADEVRTRKWGEPDHEGVVEHIRE